MPTTRQSSVNLLDGCHGLSDRECSSGHQNRQDKPSPIPAVAAVTIATFPSRRLQLAASGGIAGSRSVLAIQLYLAVGLPLTRNVFCKTAGNFISSNFNIHPAPADRCSTTRRLERSRIFLQVQCNVACPRPLRTLLRYRRDPNRALHGQLTLYATKWSRSAPRNKSAQVAHFTERSGVT